MICFHIPFQPNMLLVCWPSPITLLHSLLLSTSPLITHLTQTYYLHASYPSTCIISICPYPVGHDLHPYPVV
ncbi:hypothetical protein B0O80DRAFT_474287 [Mortierella sp. GBAus27b]|nr:hypothetical protein B0O80DRAFT_474287 [Mortierella sp. GBAus27b]